MAGYWTAESFVTRHIDSCALESKEIWDKPRARSMRRAYAAGYWKGVGSPLSVHCDLKYFVEMVDNLSYQIILAHGG